MYHSVQRTRCQTQLPECRGTENSPVPATSRGSHTPQIPVSTLRMGGIRSYFRTLAEICLRSRGLAQITLSKELEQATVMAFWKRFRRSASPFHLRILWTRVFYNFMVCRSLHVQDMFVTKGRNPVGLSREYGMKPVLMRTGRREL